MMIKGTTKSGFNYEVAQERLENYDLFEKIGEMEENPFVIAKVVKLLLGTEQANKLKDHVRSDSGFVPSDKMSEEITEIFQKQAETKNS